MRSYAVRTSVLIGLLIGMLGLSAWAVALDGAENSELEKELRADATGREATYVTLSKYTAAAGGTLEVTAHVTGYQKQDSTTTSRYDIWAESSFGEETYFIARNQTATQSELSVPWSIPGAIPTGDYWICADQEHPVEGTPWSDSKECSPLLTIDRYNLLVSFENPMPLPGEELRVHALVSNALDGSPEAPESGGWQIDYYTRDENDDLNSQRKTGIFGTGSNLQFTFLLPSNIVDWFDINVQVWANGSGGDQVERVTESIGIGSITVNVQQPYTGTTIVPDAPFILSLNSYRQHGADSYPEAGMSLNVDIKQEDETKRIVSNVQTDGDGYSSTVATLAASSDITDGPAIIFVSWTDPADLSIRNATSSIFISTGAGAASGGGMGIDLTANVPNDESEPGDVVMLVLKTRDDLGMPLPNCWIHYRTIRESSYHDDHGGVWQASRTDSTGLLYLNITIPANLNPAAGDIRLNAIAWNETGATDYGNFDLQIINPDVELSTKRSYWIPGETIDMEVDSAGMKGKVTGFWSIGALDVEGMIEFDAGSTGTFSFAVPAVVDYETFTIVIITIDGRGSIESDSHYMSRQTGISVAVQQLDADAVFIGGGTIELAYTIVQLDPENAIDFPVEWQTSLLGVEDSEQSGKVNQTSGTIQLTIPGSVESGTYLITVLFENAEEWGGYQIIEVRSEDDGSGVTGAFASTTDAISPAAPIISIVALLLGLTALVLTLLRGGRGNDDDDGGPGDFGLTAVPTAPEAAPLPTATQPMHAFVEQSQTHAHAAPPPSVQHQAPMQPSMEQMAMSGHSAPPPGHMQPGGKERGPY